jgi:hypothetical protein
VERKTQATRKQQRNQQIRKKEHIFYPPTTSCECGSVFTVRIKFTAGLVSIFDGKFGTEILNM